MLGDIITQLCVEKNMDMRRIERETGLTKAALNNLKEPSNDILQDLALVLSMDYDKLVERMEKEQKKNARKSGMEAESIRLKNLGKNILKLRIESNMTRATFAKSVNASASDVKDWEEGITEPNAEAIKRMSDTVEYKYGVFYSDNDNLASDGSNAVTILRESTGMRKKEFALYYDIPIDTLNQWENGRRTPPEYVLKLISRVIELEKKLDQKDCCFSFNDALDLAYEAYQDSKTMEPFLRDLLQYRQKGYFKEILNQPSQYSYIFINRLMKELDDLNEKTTKTAIENEEA